MLKKLIFILFLFLYLTGTKGINPVYNDGFIFGDFKPIINTVYAEKNFRVDANIEYKVLETGNTAITHTITIRNNSTYEYAKSYSLELSNLNPVNIKAYEKGSSIPLNIKKEQSNYKVNVDFTKPITGKDKSRTFIVTYEENNIAKLNGEVWEVSIPQIKTRYDSYKITLSVPDSFGQEALITPEASEKKKHNQRLIYTFKGKDLERFGINAVFGKFQVYSLKLKYHLTNTDDKRKVLNIAIPPDTSTQRVFYKNISPSPKNIIVDEDGNWIAYFEIQPKRSQSVLVEGYTQVFANPIKIFAPYPSTILENLKPQKYWESEDPQIKEIALHLKTPENIYNFVVSNLTYNYDRVKPDVERFGAKKALSKTNEAICTEFTDLFIALCRAAGIPAREINGYAHSDNPDLQPLSLISDILHSWPEYWDDTRQNWIPVDPTWESTSEIDYFNNFDLKHIAFVIHGKNSTYPLSAGSYKSENFSKDVFVEFSSLPSEINNNINITYEIKNKLNLFTKKLVVNIINNKTSAIYNIYPKVNFPDHETEVGNIPVIPPLGTHSFETDLPLGLFAVKAPNTIYVSADNAKKTIYINKTVFATQQLLIFFSILLLILLYIGSKTKRIKFETYITKIKSILKNASKT